MFSWPTHAQETWPGVIETLEYEGRLTNAFAQVFMNLVIEDGFEEREGGEKVPVKMAARSVNFPKF